MLEKNSEAGPRAIELQIDVKASPEQVWAALTDPEELKRWFPPDARVTPGAGGSIWLSWGPGVEGEARIETWDPPRRFRWVEEHGGTRLAVEWQIEARGGSTAVRLVHSGFGSGDKWDDWYDGTRRGWSYFVANLKHYLEVHRGTERALVWARRQQQRSREEAWARLFGPGGFDLAAAPAAGEACVLRWSDASLPTRVLAAESPHSFAALLPDLAQALLFVEMESSPGIWHCGVWLSTYGLSGDRVKALQAGLDRLADRVLA